jgi:hypothetical protein
MRRAIPEINQLLGMACGPPEGGHPVRLLSPGDKVDLNVLYLVGGGDGSCTETHPQAAPW